jgi:hypothetical protein
MNPNRLKPIKKINELQLLITIYLYPRKHGWPPTAEALMGLKSKFAPSLKRADTLRMWLLRHKNRSIKIVHKRRPYDYEVNRQGERRIVFLVEHLLRNAIKLQKLGVQVNLNMIQLYNIARNLEKTAEKKQMLFDLILRFLKG